MKYLRKLRRSTDPVEPIAPLTDVEKEVIAIMDAAYKEYQDKRETVAEVIHDLFYDERVGIHVIAACREKDAYDALFEYAKRIRKARE